MDGDRDLDIAVAMRYYNAAAWYEQKGEDWIYHLLYADTITPANVEAIDIDRDGDTDLVSSWRDWNNNYSKIRLHRNNGLNIPTFSTTVIIQNTFGVNRVFPMDVDNDSIPDLVATYLVSSGKVVWYENRLGQ